MKIDQEREHQPRVVSKHGSARVMRYLVNPITRRLVKSPIGKRLPFAVLRVTGRRSGITREIPCGVYAVGDAEVGFTDGAWRFNLVDGADIVMIRGREKRRVRRF
jgi:hypothetical protein